MINNIKEIVNKIVIDVTGYDEGMNEIQDDFNIVNDIRMDSLDQIEILMKLEIEFDITITDNDCEAWETMSDLYESVEKYVESK